MYWIPGVLVLIAAALLLRRLLHINEGDTRRTAGFQPLSNDRQKIYEPLAREIETQDAILGISLNDAFEERDSGREDISWRLIKLSASEWERQQEILTGLVNSISKNLGPIDIIIPLRRLSSYGFKSSTMADFVRLHEFLDQLVVRSRLRFQLRLRVLRRATAALSSEYRRACRYGDGPDGRPPELWHRLDLLYHDFNLVAKETLAAFRAYLALLPHPALEAFSADLEKATSRVARPVSAHSDD